MAEETWRKPPFPAYKREIAEKNGNLNKEYLTTASGDYSTYTSHFNEKLAADSHYHGKLKSLLDCVDVHKARKADWTEEEAHQACGREWDSLRASAVSGNLKFHQVNAKFFAWHIFRQEREEPY